jgi:predicted LPLAT superfamily acyltransferase
MSELGLERGTAAARDGDASAQRSADQDWTDRPEGGTRTAVAMFRALALGIGRRAMQLVVIPTALYFLLRRGPERRASRAYLSRILGRPTGVWQTLRHFHCFTRVYSDRIYLLADQFKRFEIHSAGLDQLVHAIGLGRGTLLLGSHVGSFEALRALSLQRPEVPLRVVLDVAHNAVITEMLHSLNPALAAGVIDARQGGHDIVFAIRDALAQNALVALLADRPRPGEATVTVDFLGAPAQFPAAPWLIASALGVPVVLCTGLFRGGNRYDLHFELLSERIEIARGTRQAQLAHWVRRYAMRLEHYLRLAPYNWFNLYDFWQSARAAAVQPDDTGRGRDGGGR